MDSQLLLAEVVKLNVRAIARARDGALPGYVIVAGRNVWSNVKRIAHSQSDAIIKLLSSPQDLSSPKHYRPPPCHRFPSTRMRQSTPPPSLPEQPRLIKTKLSNLQRRSQQPQPKHQAVVRPHRNPEQDQQLPHLHLITLPDQHHHNQAQFQEAALRPQ